MAACASGARTASAGKCSAIAPLSRGSACTVTTGVGVASLLLQPASDTPAATNAAAATTTAALVLCVLLVTTSPSASADSPGPSHSALHHPRAHSPPLSVRFAHPPPQAPSLHPRRSAAWSAADSPPPSARSTRAMPPAAAPPLLPRMPHPAPQSGDAASPSAPHARHRAESPSASRDVASPASPT